MSLNSNSKCNFIEVGLRNIYWGELFNFSELNPENLTSKMEIANARIRIHMPKVRS
jgi:hypothetical protein